MALTHLINVTPLTVQVRLTGGGNTPICVLKPSDQTIVNTPRGAEFEVSDESGRLIIGQHLSAKNEKQDLQITDDVVRCRSGGFHMNTWPRKIINDLPYAVRLFQLGDNGQEVLPVDIAAGGSKDWPLLKLQDLKNLGVASLMDAVPYQWTSGPLRVRKAAGGEKLDLIVPRPGGGSSESLQIYRLTDRYEGLQGLAESAAELTRGRYDVIKADVLPPDPADTKYIRYGDQTIGSRELNGWNRPVRRVTISGVDLVFEKSDRSRFLSMYEGAEDIAELKMHADTILIKTELRFPGTNISIYCRTLQFEGAESYIDTTPKDKSFRDPYSQDGEDGANAGNITIFTSYFRTDQPETKHFRACGARGQDPDEGGVEPSKSVRNLEPITEQKWNEFFSHENRKLPHEEVFGDKWGYTAVMDFPNYQLMSRDCPNIVYIEIRNRHYRNNIHTVVSDPELLRQWGSMEEPGKGGRGTRPGTPGVGGTGGRLTSTLTEVVSHMDLRGGASGNALPATRGGAGGTPSVLSWLFFDAWPDGSSHPVRPRWERKVAEEGESSEPGLPPRAPAGPEGSFVFEEKAHRWISPINLSLVTQYARDAAASGDTDYGVSVLSPYVITLESLTIDPDLEQPLAEARELLRLAKQNADYFGKPPGWVPTLSLESAVGIYDTLVPHAMNELYASYYIGKIAQSKQSKLDALRNLRRLLNESSETASEELTSLRKDLPKATVELQQLLLEIEDVSEKLAEREKALRQRADKETITYEQKEAAAAALKIAGAVVKAIPLPEPFQTAAGGFGSLLDITGGLLEEGGADSAFQDLKTKVTAFADDDSLVNYMSSKPDASLDVTALEKQADAARKDKEALEGKYGEQSKQLEDLKEKRKAVYEAKKEALLYSRATTLKDRARIVKAAEGITTKYQDDVTKLEATANGKVKDYTAAKEKVAGIESEIAAKKQDFEKDKENRDKKKAENAKAIATRMKQLKNVANSIASISATLSKLAVSRSQLNSKFDQALAKLEKEDNEFSNLAERIKFLNVKKETVAQNISQLSTDITSRTDKIVKNMLAVNELAAQIATSNESLDPSALVYIQSIGQDAHATLTRFLYYTVKAYEYYMVAPWSQSYVSAQKLFDDLKRVLEPSTFKLDAATDPNGEKQENIKSLLATDPRKGGMLSPSDYAMLKLVYEKPLLDMGRQLASELMESSGKTLRETRSTVTLTEAWLGDLNDRLKSPDKLNQVILNLVDLRHIGRSVEKQRISNIRVIGIKAIKSGELFPDTVKVTFEHLGKSIVRARGQLFAFEPQTTADGAGAGDSGSGIVFETQGGRAHESVGWVEQSSAGRTVGELKGTSLWQPTRDAQENLISKLLKNPAMLSLSQFRPGAFSDFLLKVEINPPERKIAFTEIVLEVSYEGGNARRDEILVCVNNDVGLEIPVRTNVKDISGRTGGIGRYIGVFSSNQMRAAGQRTVRVTVPVKFGQYELKSWQIDGEQVPATNPFQDIAKDAYVVVSYARNATT